MNVIEFRKTEPYTSWLMSVKVSPHWAALLDALEGSHPRKQKSDDDPLLQLGAIQGYDKAIEFLHELSRPVKEAYSIEATFEAEGETEEKGK